MNKVLSLFIFTFFFGLFAQSSFAMGYRRHSFTENSIDDLIKHHDIFIITSKTFPQLHARLDQTLNPNFYVGVEDIPYFLWKDRSSNTAEINIFMPLRSATPEELTYLAEHPIRLPPNDHLFLTRSHFIDASTTYGLLPEVIEEFRQVAHEIYPRVLGFNTKKINGIDKTFIESCDISSKPYQCTPIVSGPNFKGAIRNLIVRRIPESYLSDKSMVDNFADSVYDITSYIAPDLEKGKPHRAQFKTLLAWQALLHNKAREIYDKREKALNSPQPQPTQHPVRATSRAAH